ncbi:hypothetical protein [Methylobacterium sp. WSM2598]|uniref:hypothetical protein n=1 Tax=Methylobacterium sp. WSM2598 TaxID=398261 RepID=UPI0012F703DB|nr:hypothetical protein [Methylobacterium sp. WSM2598]
MNLAEYDKLTGQVADLAREQGAATRRAAEEEPESNAAAYTRENARRVAYQADLAHLELQERLGQLVRVDSLRPAIQRAAASTAKILDGLVQEADTLRAVCARDDGRELERTLKTIAHRMRSDIAAALAAVRPGVAAPEDGGPAG